MRLPPFIEKILRVLIILALALAAVTPAAAANPVLPGVSASQRSPALPELMQKAQAAGSLAVMVELAIPFQLEANLNSPRAIRAQQAALGRSQDALLARLAGYDPASVKKYHFIPALALRVSPAGLAALAADAAVLHLVEDKVRLPALAESVPLIGAPAAWAAGYSGAGQVVAVLDTGVDKNHPFLAGKVVAEACYSTTNAADGAASLCPDGVSSSTASDSALPYLTGVCPAGECNHGTHVAGIAVGRTNGSNPGFNGVAKDANLIAIQVFSKFEGTYCSGTCVLSYESDEILGLQRVYDLRSTYAIAAANLSLGSDNFAVQASCDAANPLSKAAIDVLRSVGIATVISAGNNGSASSLSAPGCISSAISVGSVGDGSGGTSADAISYFSNSTPFLKLLAPGAVITSSIPFGYYTTMMGTSMAAPHVTGAWAVLKSKYPGASVDQILAAFQASGKPVTDSRNSVVTARIQVDLAAAQTYSASGQVTLGSGLSATGLAGVTVSDGTGHSTLTASDGSFSLENLPLETAILTPSLDGYIFDPPNVNLAVGPSQSGFQFAAAVAYTVSGKVTVGSGAGAPGLAGATLSVDAAHFTLSAADGSYSLALAAGDYSLTASKDEYTFDQASLPLSLGPGQSGVNFSATLNTYSISGQVLLGGGISPTGMAGVTVSAGAGHSTLSDGGGNYHFDGLLKGTYTLSANLLHYGFNPASLSVAVGPSHAGVNFTGTYLPISYFWPDISISP